MQINSAKIHVPQELGLLPQNFVQRLQVLPLDKIRRFQTNLDMLATAQSKFSENPLLTSRSNPEYWRVFAPVLERGRMLDGDRSLFPFADTFGCMMENMGAKSVLEIGCGTGRILPAIEGRGFRYTGTDMIPEVIEKARQLHPGAEFRAANVLNFPKMGPFGAAIATDVLLYLSPKEQVLALDTLFSLLRPGSPVLIRWAYNKSPIFDLKEYTIRGQQIFGWAHHVNERYLSGLLETCGFKVFGQIKRLPIALGKGKTMDFLIAYAFRNLWHFDNWTMVDLFSGTR